MRILIIGINFHPELTGIGKYTGEFVSFLSKKGHILQVVTAPPYYPFWKVQRGYKSWSYETQFWQGAEVTRCPLWVPGSPTGVKRIIHLLSFALSSFPVLLSKLKNKPDMVLCIAPAFFCAPFALIAAYLSGAKSWLHIQDFELDAATKLGILPAANIFSRLAIAGEKLILKNFDRVSSISESMISHLIDKGVAPDKVELFPNWVNTEEIFPIKGVHDSSRIALGIPQKRVVILYSGNMGKKQGLEDLISVAKSLAHRKEIHFVLCGNGAARSSLEVAAKGMHNISFLSLQPAEELNNLLNLADIHILLQRADAADLVMPSKLLGMLASGKPVIATANQGTELEKVVSRVGKVVPPGDLAALCDSIIELVSSPDHCYELGMKGRMLVTETWSEEIILSSTEKRFRDFLNM